MVMTTYIFYFVLVFSIFFGQVCATSCSSGQYFTGTTCKKIPANGLWNNEDPGLYKSGIYPYSRTYVNWDKRTYRESLPTPPFIFVDGKDVNKNGDAMLVNNNNINIDTRHGLDGGRGGYCTAKDKETGEPISEISFPCMVLIKAGSYATSTGETYDTQRRIPLPITPTEYGFPFLMGQNMAGYCTAWLINNPSNVRNVAYLVNRAVKLNPDEVDITDTVFSRLPDPSICYFNVRQIPDYWLTNVFQDLSINAYHGRGFLTPFDVETPSQGFNVGSDRMESSFRVGVAALASDFTANAFFYGWTCNNTRCSEYGAQNGFDWPAKSMQFYTNFSWPGLVFDDIKAITRVKYLGLPVPKYGGDWIRQGNADGVCYEYGFYVYDQNHRGCNGFGECPYNATGAVCSGHGRCSTMGLCLCDPDWGGDLCDKAIPSTYLYYNATCAEAEQFDVCSGRGDCKETTATFIAPGDTTSTSHRIVKCDCYPPWTGNSPDHVPLAAAGLYRTHNDSLWYADTTAFTGTTETVYEHIAKRQCKFYMGADSGNFVSERKCKGCQDSPVDLDRITSHTQPVWIGFTNLTDYNPVDPIGYQCRKGFIRNHRWECVPCPPCDERRGTCKLRDPDGNSTFCECDFNWAGTYCNLTTCPCALDSKGDCHSSSICSGSLRGVCVDPTDEIPLFNSSYQKVCQCYDGFGVSGNTTVNYCQTAFCPLTSDGYSCGNKIMINNTDGSQAFEKKGSCNITSGTCQCEKSSIDGHEHGWIGTTCDRRACAMTHDNSECNSQTIGTDFCNTTSLECQCHNAYPGSGDINEATSAGLYWGTACQNSFTDSCSKDGIWCSGNGLSCEPDDRTSSLSAPKCKCKVGFKGDHCELSDCGPRECRAYVNNVTLFNGVCVHLCDYGHGQKTECKSTSDVTEYIRGGSDSYCECRGYEGSFYAGPHCNVPADECFSSNVTVGDERNTGKPCSGFGQCVRNDANHTYQCECDISHNTTDTALPCGNQKECGGTCTGEGEVCVEDPKTDTHYCSCLDPYVSSGGTCIDMCTPTSGNLTDNNRTCICPAGSVWYPDKDEAVEFPATKGCRKLCPLYEGVECGSRPANHPAYTRCNIVLFNDSTTANCTCEFLGLHFLAKNSSDQVRMRFVNSTAIPGGCEPYCVHCIGANSQEGYDGCDLTGSRYNGTRCDTLACNGRGVLNPGAATCSCDQPNVYSGDFCEVDACGTGGTYPGNGSRCSCTPGTLYTPQKTTTENKHENNTLRVCVAPCQHNSTISSDGTQCENCGAVYGGEYCENTLCQYGVPATNGSVCICEFPQFQGTYCNETQCTNGGVAFVHKDGCECPTFYNGTLCETDVCQHSNGQASADGMYCDCDAGYSNDTHSGLCHKSLCHPGFPTACTFDATSCPLNYTCTCAQAYTTTPASGVCTFTESQCSATNMIVGGNGTCICAPGYVGTQCDQEICNSTNNRIRYNVSTGACECIPPYTNLAGGCDQTWCGPHEGGEPICTTHPDNDDSITGCVCNCTEGYIPRRYEYENGTRPCVLFCHYAYSNDTTAPHPKYTHHVKQGLSPPRDFEFKDTDISTSSCTCLDNMTGDHCHLSGNISGINNEIDQIINRHSSSSKVKAWMIAVGAGVFVFLVIMAFTVYYCCFRNDSDYSIVSQR